MGEMEQLVKLLCAGGGLNFSYGLQGKGFCPWEGSTVKAALSVGLFLILGFSGVPRKGGILKLLF